MRRWLVIGIALLTTACTTEQQRAEYRSRMLYELSNPDYDFYILCDEKYGNLLYIRRSAIAVVPNGCPKTGIPPEFRRAR